MADYVEGLKMLPDYMRDGMRLYIEHGISPGGFLSAVLSNNLRGAFERADSTNQPLVGDYVRYLYNYVPSQCWGSEERFETWIARGGLQSDG